MAHELEIVNGQAKMFYRGEAPWHKLGTFIPPEKELTAEEAIIMAGLDWTVSTQGLYLANGKQAPSNAVVRSDTGDILGVVGKNYTPLQNSKAFQFFDPFISSGQAVYETAGSLRDGKRIWVLAKIQGQDGVVKGNDTISRYVLLSNGHDGFMSVRVGFTDIRVVCANTMAMAHNDATSQLLRIKHGKNIEENLDKIAEIMNMANSKFEARLEQYRFLANKEISSADLERYVKLVFVGDKFEEMEKQGLNPGKRILEKVIPLFEKGRGNDMREVKGTAWTAYNAVNEYLQYERGNDEESRLDKMWFGDSANLNQKAFDLIIKLVA